MAGARGLPPSAPGSGPGSAATALPPPPPLPLSLSPCGSLLACGEASSSSSASSSAGGGGGGGFRVHCRAALERARDGAAPPAAPFSSERALGRAALCCLLAPTNLLAYVGAGGRQPGGRGEAASPRCVVLRDAAAAEGAPGARQVLRLPCRVTAVRLCRSPGRVVALVRGEARVYDLRTLRELARVPHAANDAGLVCLSDAGVLALPAADARPGAVLLYDAARCEVLAEVAAHDSPLAALALSQEGGAAPLLATASDKGTIVRVFRAPDGKRTASFRRGRQPTRILALAFASSGASAAPGRPALLAAASASGAVHIFRLDAGAAAAEAAQSVRRVGGGAAAAAAASAAAAAATAARLARGALSAAASVGVMPARLVDAVEPPTAAVIVRLPLGRAAQLVALRWPDGGDEHAMRLVALCADGHAYEYEVRADRAGAAEGAEPQRLVWHHDLSGRSGGGGGAVDGFVAVDADI